MSVWRWRRTLRLGRPDTCITAERRDPSGSLRLRSGRASSKRRSVRPPCAATRRMSSTRSPSVAASCGPRSRWPPARVMKTRSQPLAWRFSIVGSASSWSSRPKPWRRARTSATSAVSSSAPTGARPAARRCRRSRSRATASSRSPSACSTADVGREAWRFDQWLSSVVTSSRTCSTSPAVMRAPPSASIVGAVASGAASAAASAARVAASRPTARTSPVRRRRRSSSPRCMTAAAAAGSSGTTPSSGKPA